MEWKTKVDHVAATIFSLEMLRVFRQTGEAKMTLALSQMSLIDPENFVENERLHREYPCRRSVGTVVSVLYGNDNNNESDKTSVKLA